MIRQLSSLRSSQNQNTIIMGASASSLPDKVTLDQAKSLAGDRFDDAKWQEAADPEGNVTKETFLSWGDAAPVPGGGVTREQAEAEAAADM